jgi:hypothetical protein
MNLQTTETLLYVAKQVFYMGIVGSFPFNSFLSGVLSCIGTAVLAGRDFLPTLNPVYPSSAA